MDNNVKELSGWYYDLQIKNRLLSATLHPSMVLNENTGKWRKIYDSEGKDKDNPEYREEPLCRAIVTEDFNVSVANTWSDFGGDMLGQMWEAVKPMAPYVDSIKGMIHSAVEDWNKQKKENTKDYQAAKGSTVASTFADFMVSIDNKLQNGQIDVVDYLNRALVVQGTRFSYYSGSGTSFGNLMMKFTIFPTYKNSTFISVDDQVNELIPYCIGKFVKGTDGITEEDSNTHKLLDGMIAWQKPPGGFRANIKNVDVVQEGTLLLKFGAYYIIDNLVVENAVFNFSKQMTKNPNGYAAGGSILSPLYCDVAIQLRPATKYSDITLKRFISSRGQSTTLTNLNDSLRSNVETLLGDIYSVGFQAPTIV